MKSPDVLSVSFVLPAYNEGASIGGVIQSIPRRELHAAGIQTEVVVVDNNSKDTTKAVALAAGATVIPESIPGYGAALQTGIRAAQHKIVITGDADGTYPFEIAPQLLQYYSEGGGVEFLNTNRRLRVNRDSMSASSWYGNMFLARALRSIYGHNFPFKDVLSGMWVFDREQMLEVLTHPRVSPVRGFDYSTHIKIAAYHSGMRCREVPIPYSVRSGGESSIDVARDGIRTLAHAVAYRPQMRNLRRQG